MSVNPFKASISGASRGSALNKNLQSNVKRDMDKIVDNFRKWAAHMQAGAGEVLLDALEPTFEKSQVLVPERTGRLKASGFLEETSFRGRTQVQMGYARGGEPPYAVEVHEDLEAFHHEPTQAKFLQQPLEQDEQEIQQRIASGLKLLSGT